MNYEEKILTRLVDAYRNSKKDTGDNVIQRRTRIKPEKIYNKYHSNDGDFDKIQGINEAVSSLEDSGFVYAEKEKYGTEITAIYLNDDKINTIEKYLADTFGHASKDSKLDTLKQIIKKYYNASKTCGEECQELQQLLEKRSVPNNITELDAAYKAIAFIENNTEPLFVREVSMRVYGDSKYFENNTINLVCGILKKHNEYDSEEGEILDEVLKKYNIFKEPQKLSIKGKVLIHINGVWIDINAFDNGIEFNADELDKIDMVVVKAKSFMTIENRTSYLRFNDNNIAVFYLCGYVNRDQRDFIKLVFKCNPNITYYHFGDIDPGGLWIHHDLCTKTGVKFKLFSMSKEELANTEYADCLHELTDNDIVRLRELLKLPEYSDVVKYMLENRVKLEQEIVSWKLMSKG